MLISSGHELTFQFLDMFSGLDVDGRGKSRPKLMVIDMQWCHVQHSETENHIQDWSWYLCIHPRIDHENILTASRCHTELNFHWKWLTWFRNAKQHINKVLLNKTWGPLFPLTEPSKKYILIIYIRIIYRRYPNLPFRDHIPLKKTKISQVGPYDLGFTGATLCLCGCIGHSLSFCTSFWMFFERPWGEIDFWTWSQLGGDLRWSHFALWGSGTKSRWRSLSFFYCKKTFTKVGKEIEDFGILTDMFLKFGSIWYIVGQPGMFFQVV